MYRRTFAEINLDSLAHNFQALQAAFPQTDFLCPMVKANAYGHGDAAVAACLEKLGARHLGVCLIEEGLILRRHGIQADILVFRGFDREGAVQMLKHRLTPVVATWEQLDIVERMAEAPVGIHLKFNTGMNRLGFAVEEAPALFQRLVKNSKLKVDGILTHLYQSEDAVDPGGDSARQLRSMRKVVELFKPLKPVVHALNSGGILSVLKVRGLGGGSHPLLETSWGLRPGLMIYGYNPLNDTSPLPLKPVMTLKSIASTFRVLQPGETVSYGATWKAAKETVLAVVPIGYADGYHRALSNKAKVLFEGRRVPVAGAICMDFLMLDVSDVVKPSQIKDFKDHEIILLGESAPGIGVSATELAALAGTISWEILTSVGERVPRVYTGEWARKLGVAS